jgi:ABC-type branched-subunit amino acid transport system substrate-binding protein
LSRLFFARPANRRVFLNAAVGFLAFGAMALLAACNSGGGFSGFGRNSAPAVRTAMPVTGETIGSGSVKVALLLPLTATGNAGQIATAFRNAADLALRDFKSANIQILIKDDQGTAEGARAAASEAISQGAELILGPLFARSVTGVSTVARAANVPVIAFSSDTTIAGQGLYLLSFLPQSDVDRIVSYSATLGKRSIAALLPNNAYGTLVEAALQRAAANAGGRVMASVRYDLDKTAMQTQATSVAALVKGGTVDAVMLPDAGDAVPFLAQVLAANGVTPDKMTYLGSGQWDNDPRIVGESNLSGGYFPAPENAGFASFSRRYQAAFGSPPSRTASLAYDATSLAAGLAGRFGDQRFAPATLTNPNGFIGIDGAFRFLPNGLNQRGLAVYQIQKGQAVVADPAPKSFARAPGT